MRTSQRRADALAKLTAEGADLWIATASSEGRVHLVPVSFAWDGRLVIVETGAVSRTAQNLIATRRARLALGTTRDVVMVDVSLVESIPVAEAPDHVAERYAVQVGWDPRAEPGGLAYFLLRPERIQVWRGSSEQPGRTVMRAGEWLV